MRVDLHVHTCASPDSLTRPERALWWAKRRGLDALAITDHDTLDAAREIAGRAELVVIVGEEVNTSEGEVIGLFLHETIPPGSSAADTIGFIHEQGGLAILPHPYDALRGSALKSDIIERVIPDADMVEVFNARVFSNDANARAFLLARNYHKPCGAGSDAHLGSEIGRAFIDIPSFNDRDSFWSAACLAVPNGRRSPAVVHLGSGLARLVKPLAGLRR